MTAMMDHIWALGHMPMKWGPIPGVSAENWAWLLKHGYIEHNREHKCRITEKGWAILRVRTPGPPALAAMKKTFRHVPRQWQSGKFYVYRWTEEQKIRHALTIGPAGESEDHIARGEVIGKDLSFREAQDLFDRTPKEHLYEYGFTNQDKTFFI